MVIRMKELSTLIPELRQIALDSGANDLRLIATDIIKTAAWVRLKCRYGCKAYGKHLSCPPYSPTPEETEKVLSDYEDAVLVEFVGLPKETTVDPRHIHHHLWDLILQIQDVIFNLERSDRLTRRSRHLGWCCFGSQNSIENPQKSAPIQSLETTPES
jgi:predicted metal-binding protein